MTQQDQAPRNIDHDQMTDETTTSQPNLDDTELEKTLQTTEQPTTFQSENIEISTQSDLPATTLNIMDIDTSREKQGRRIEDDQQRRNTIELKDVLKNYDNFRKEIISKKPNHEKKDGVLKPIIPTILRRATTPIPEGTTMRGR